MKHLKSLSAIAAIAALSSQIAVAEPIEISSELKLVGFSGGSCNITVNANANATNLDLDNHFGPVDVATVNTQCDYDYRVTVDADRDFGGASYALTHYQDEFTFVPFELNVDGVQFTGGEPTNEVGFYPAGLETQMPVEIDTFGALAPVPGIYQGTVTFSIVID